MFFGPRLNTVFKSRWKALFWAAGVLATAYCTVPVADQVDQHEKQVTAKSQHSNPWSKDAPAAN